MTPQEKILALEIENERLRNALEWYLDARYLPEGAEESFSIGDRAHTALTATAPSDVMGKLKQIRVDLDRLVHWSDIAQTRMLDSDNWPGNLTIGKGREAMAIFKELGVE